MTDPAPEGSVSADEAAHFLGVTEREVEDLAGADGCVPLEKLRSRAGSAALALELARAREEVGRLSGQLKEVRAQSAGLQKDLKESVAERRRLTEEVLALRAAAEERLMLMERVEQMARLERELEARTLEVELLENRGLLGRLMNR